ncbi:Cytoplasmic dynein light chain [Fasciola hepatica]|uniref:Cytoplasmic dynein light chain n=1 Tax=Fasciola hepatica TaxID=6192 RepID=A0A4E0QUZ9_FASHE|nr:Cytoplasmic dynein light chain [Fasciola hepatica]
MHENSICTILVLLQQPAAFNGIEATGIIKEIIGNVVGASDFSANKIKQWTSTIIEQSISQLARLNRPFKYIVSCVMMQRNGAGLQTGSACYWDSSTDGCYTLKWENKSMYCFVTVFGISI